MALGRQGTNRLSVLTSICLLVFVVFQIWPVKEPAPRKPSTPSAPTYKATGRSAPPVTVHLPPPPALPVKQADPVETPPAAPRPQKSTMSPAPFATDLTVGLSMLRILEHGSGPDIHIAWPETPAGRDKLFTVMTRCYGLTLALMDDQNRLYRDADAANLPWTPNLDRFSGFIRLARVARGSLETARIAALRRRHAAIKNTLPVRVFPRRVDGALLAGLARLSAGSSHSLTSVRGAYGLDGQRVFVAGWHIDGRAKPGAVDLSGQARCGNGHS